MINKNLNKKGAIVFTILIVLGIAIVGGTSVYILTTLPDELAPMNLSSTFASEELPKYFNLDETLESVYGAVRVYDEDGIRTMRVGNGIMGRMNISNKFIPVNSWGYLYFMMDVNAITEPENVLVLGTGTGIIATGLNEQYGINVDAVDINPQVLEVANKYFGLDSSDSLRLFDMDARIFLKETEEKYDVINQDTFNYINEKNDYYNEQTKNAESDEIRMQSNEEQKGHYVIPPHLTTKEYYELLESRLTDEGYLVLMLFDNAGFSEFFINEYTTLKSVFNNCYVFDPGIVVMICSDNEMEFPKEFDKFKYKHIIPEGIVYTDDYVPISPFQQ